MVVQHKAVESNVIKFHQSLLNLCQLESKMEGHYQKPRSFLHEKKDLLNWKFRKAAIIVILSVVLQYSSAILIVKKHSESLSHKHAFEGIGKENIVK